MHKDRTLSQNNRSNNYPIRSFDKEAVYRNNKTKRRGGGEGRKEERNNLEMYLIICKVADIEMQSRTTVSWKGKERTIGEIKSSPLRVARPLALPGGQSCRYVPAAIVEHAWIPT